MKENDVPFPQTLPFLEWTQWTALTLTDYWNDFSDFHAHRFSFSVRLFVNFLFVSKR